MDEELAVPLWPEQAGWGRTENLEPQLGGASADLYDDLPMRFRVTDHTTFSDMTPANLELRLDQRQDLTGIGKKRWESWENRGKRDESEIYSGKVWPVREVVRRQCQGVGPFHDGHSGIGPESHVKLPAPDINGIDTGGAMLKQTVGKSPR
jgi:hypothetical protein